MLFRSENIEHLMKDYIETVDAQEGDLIEFFSDNNHDTKRVRRIFDRLRAEGTILESNNRLVWN